MGGGGRRTWFAPTEQGWCQAEVCLLRTLYWSHGRTVEAAEFMQNPAKDSKTLWVSLTVTDGRCFRCVRRVRIASPTRLIGFNGGCDLTLHKTFDLFSLCIVQTVTSWGICCGSRQKATSTY